VALTILWAPFIGFVKHWLPKLFLKIAKILGFVQLIPYPLPSLNYLFLSFLHLEAFILEGI
jgi:hypothetical protein